MRGVLGNQHSYRDQLTATNLKKMLMDIDVSEENNGHQKGGRATHSIARFLDHSALLLLLAWNSHAASSRLMKQLAIRLGYQKTIAKSLVIAQRPKKRILECVQLPFLGLTMIAQ